MFRKEILGILKSRSSMIAIIFICLIPLIDLLLIIYQGAIWDYYLHREAYEYIYPAGDFLPHPSMASFLSGYSIGHLPQRMLKWLLPIYLLIIYCDSPIREKKLQYNSLLYIRTTRTNVIKNKILVAFLVPMVIIFIALMINYILCNIVFHTGTSFSGHEITVARGGLNAWTRFCILNPIISYILYILFFTLITGVVGIQSLVIATVFQDYKIVYPFAFVLWYIEYNMLAIGYSATQPYTEDNLSLTMGSIFFYIIIGIIFSVFGYIYNKKREVL